MTNASPLPESAREFLKRQGISPRQEGLYLRAFTHRSYLNEARQPGLACNEKLEFLGDSVLGLLVSQHLYEAFPDLNEGQLARKKAVLVSESSLAPWAGSLGLGRALLLGRGEESTGGREKKALLADALEALLAALYLDQGMDAVRTFLRPLLEKDPGEQEQGGLDAKTQLQEWSQKRFKKPPTYKVTQALGPDHAKVFEVEVLLEGKVLGAGKGKNKKEAERLAANRALAQIKKSRESDRD